MALRTACLAAFVALGMAKAHAIGLGQVNVQSPLGQPLRASIPLLGIEGARPLATCFTARLSSADGAFITAPRITLTPGTASASVNLATSIPIAEPALTLMIEMGCGEGLQREFSLLLDPPMNPASTPLQPLEATANGSAAVRLARERNAAVTIAPTEAAPVTRQTNRPSPVAAAPAMPRPTPATANDTGVAARNVLRLGSRDGRDVELMNAIGLRLARANSLAERGTRADAAAIPDLAKAAETRAAQARFAALLRDDGAAAGRTDATAAATDQKLQDLQAKMLILENETLRLKQASQRDAAALSAARAAAPADVFGSSWVAILAALLALCAGAIAWLLIRVKHLKQHNMTWDWEENVAAADTDAAGTETAGMLSTGGESRPKPEPDLAPFANESPDHPAHQAIVAAPSDRKVAKPARSATPGLSAPMEFTPAEPVLPAAKVAAGAVAAAATGAGMAAAATVAAMPEEAAPVPAMDAKEDLNFEEIQVVAPAVEEISDVMQEAEFWISLLDSQRAIEVLEPYATTEHPSSPLPWLYLFELYADSGQRASYDLLHERFQRVFNGKIPTWDELEQRPPPVYLRGIEDVPHICDKIVALWWTEQSVPYLESLLVDDREGNRIGFDLPVYREIMFLIGIAYDIQQSKKFIKPAMGSPGWTIAA